MQHHNEQNLLVVLLEDMLSHHLPRILASKERVKHGEVFSDSELKFFIFLLDRVSYCQARYHKDPQCQVIFTTIAHLIFKVIKRAWENEQAGTTLQPETV